MSYEAKLLQLAKKVTIVGIVIAAVVLWAVQWWLNRTPAQPIAFSHQIHVGERGISCYYCHTGVLKGDQAGVIAVQDCMQCHQVVATDHPEIIKLTKYWNDKQSIYWYKVYKLPKHVHFPHKMHVNYFIEAAPKDPALAALQQKNPAVYPCLLCHGNVAAMSRIVPGARRLYKIWYGYNINPSTQMGYCINCHRSYAGKTLAGGPDVPPLEVMIDCSQCHR